MQSITIYAEGHQPVSNQIYICAQTEEIAGLTLSESETAFVAQQRKLKKDLVVLSRIGRFVALLFVKPEDAFSRRLESCRRNGAAVAAELNALGVIETAITDAGGFWPECLAVAEGMALGSYQFLKYRNDAEDKANSLRSIVLESQKADEDEVLKLNILVRAACFARDLVNEPVNKLNAVGLAEALSSRMREAGGKAEVLNKKKIEALKMGGLLSVNLGSPDPPTFTILEWKPANAVNSRPVILVGKGVVYDTGGMSLKPTSGMDTMKCDMAGGALVGAAISAIAEANLPVYVMALVPATDNRPDGNAYVPGDVITMFDGTTVEVLNTDAEGRLILADALAYARKFEPMLVINFATLTGAAARAIGPQGIVAMQVNAQNEFDTLAVCGERVYERLVQFPMWDEYREMLKSEIADLKNIGGPDAGAITAGKFLEHFTDYPFIHCDIAGPAFLDKRDSYRGLGGSGIGVRLLFEFFRNMS